MAKRLLLEANPKLLTQKYCARLLRDTCEARLCSPLDLAHITYHAAVCNEDTPQSSSILCSTMSTQSLHSRKPCRHSSVSRCTTPSRRRDGQQRYVLRRGPTLKAVQCLLEPVTGFQGSVTSHFRLKPANPPRALCLSQGTKRPDELRLSPLSSDCNMLSCPLCLRMS